MGGLLCLGGGTGVINLYAPFARQQLLHQAAFLALEGFDFRID
jgi:hypothetical protein